MWKLTENKVITVIIIIIIIIVDKCHFICSSNLKTSIMTENRQIHNSTWEKLLGVFFDSKLTFQSHIDNICKKAAHN